MPKLTFSFESEIRRAIRDISVIDPLITGTKLVETLNKRFNRSFAPRYVQKLRDKVLIEATPNLDRQKVEDRLRQTRELVRIAREALTKIAYGQSDPGIPPPDHNERMTAWRTIGFFEKLQMEIESQLGIYNKPMDTNTIDSFRWRPIPEDVRGQIMTTLRLWSMPAGLMRKIEPVAIIDAEVKEVTAQTPVEAPAKPQEAPAPSQPAHGITPDPELRLH